MSKNNVGRFLLGTAVVVAGLSLYIYFDENARATVEGIVNREKAKAFIKHNVKGSERLLKAIDKLSDNEINTVMKLIDETEKVTDKAEDAFNQFADKAKDVTSNVVERAVDLGNEVINKVSNFVG